MGKLTLHDQFLELSDFKEEFGRETLSLKQRKELLASIMSDLSKLWLPFEIAGLLLMFCHALSMDRAQVTLDELQGKINELGDVSDEHEYMNELKSACTLLEDLPGGNSQLQAKMNDAHDALSGREEDAEPQSIYQLLGEALSTEDPELFAELEAQLAEQLVEHDEDLVQLKADYQEHRQDFGDVTELRESVEQLRSRFAQLDVEDDWTAELIQTLDDIEALPKEAEQLPGAELA